MIGGYFCYYYFCANHDSFHTLYPSIATDSIGYDLTLTVKHLLVRPRDDSGTFIDPRPVSCMRV